ncbi:hypothetical protein FQZ97_784010 [compost metagenome]
MQGRERSLVVRFGTPALQRLTGTFEDVHGLLEKDLDHLCIERLITRGRARGCSRLGLDQDAGVLIDLQLNCRSRLALVLLRPGHLLERRSGGIQLDDLQARLTLRGQQGQGPRIQCLCEQTTQRLDPRRLGADLQAGSHLIHHADQGFMRLFGLTEETLADRQAALFHRTIKVEQGFTELIDLRQLGHLRAAPQSRQFIQQGAQFLTLGRMLAPALQQRLGIQQDIHALGEEDADQLRIAGFTPLALATVLRGIEAVLMQFVRSLKELRGTGQRRQRPSLQLLQAQAEQLLGCAQ